ncbi:MAG TPA: transposase [Planctomycetota bacterium]|nr:transposase [Planctomycetota bacterium]
MKKERFREEQIVRILKEAETGRMPIVEICRKYGVSEFTFYRWRRKYQGLSISEARRLRELEKENQRLKRLLAQRDLEIDAIQEVLRKNF